MQKKTVQLSFDKIVENYRYNTMHCQEKGDFEWLIMGKTNLTSFGIITLFKEIWKREFRITLDTFYFIMVLLLKKKIHYLDQLFDYRNILKWPLGGFQQETPIKQ